MTHYVRIHKLTEFSADFLAAGTAIGYAGEWEAFVDYLKTSYNGSQLGHVRTRRG